MGTAACTAANADVTFTTNGIDFAVDPATTLDIAGWLASNPNPKTGLAFHNGVTGATAMTSAYGNSPGRRALPPARHLPSGTMTA